MTEQAGHPEGLFDSLRRIATTLLAIVQTRLEIFTNELDETRARVARIVLLAAIAAFCLGLALILFVFFLVVLYWDTNRLLAIGVLTGVFAAGGLIACLMLRKAIVELPKFLSATLAELRKDRARLDGQ